jgi:hypothetical protein
MTVSEPVTLLTDYALGGLCAWLGWRLTRSAGGEVSRRLWATAFLALAVSAFAGGTYHGFAPLLGEAAAGLLWKFTVVAIGVFSFGMMAGSACATTRGALRSVLIAASVIQLAAYGAWMMTHDEYGYVVLDTAAAMGLLVALHGWAAVSRSDTASRWILAGVAVSALAAMVQYFRVAPHQHFNHNDLYHVVQIAAMALFHAGGKLLRDRGDANGQ